MFLQAGVVMPTLNGVVTVSAARWSCATRWQNIPGAALILRLTGTLNPAGMIMPSGAGRSATSLIPITIRRSAECLNISGHGFRSVSHVLRITTMIMAHTRAVLFISVDHESMEALKKTLAESRGGGAFKNLLIQTTGGGKDGGVNSAIPVNHR